MRRAAALIAGALLLTGCGETERASLSASAGPTATAPVACVPAPSATPSPSGGNDLAVKPEIEVPDAPPPCTLVVTDLIQGRGPTATAGQSLTVKYAGVTYLDGKEFDSSWGKGDFTFPLGGGQVIAGWDQGLLGMAVGGRRQLVIPPNLGYGTRGAGPIPPNATLIFVIDLVSIA